MTKIKTKVKNKLFRGVRVRYQQQLFDWVDDLYMKTGVFVSRDNQHPNLCYVIFDGEQVSTKVEINAFSRI